MSMLCNILAFCVQSTQSQSVSPVDSESRLVNLADSVAYTQNPDINLLEKYIPYRLEDKDADRPSLSSVTGHQFCCGFCCDASRSHTFDIKCTEHKVSVKRPNDQTVTSNECCTSCYKRTRDICDRLRDIVEGIDDSKANQETYFVVVKIEGLHYMLCREPEQFILVSVVSDENSIENDSYLPTKNIFKVSAFTEFARKPFNIIFEPVSKLHQELKDSLAGLNMEIIRTSYCSPVSVPAPFSVQEESKEDESMIGFLIQ